MLNSFQKQELLKIAKESVETFVREGRVSDFDVHDKALNKSHGAFVTLHLDGTLRGCIGRIEVESEPLWQVVRDMAIEAAVHDYRFDPVQESELDKLNYEISVLTVPEKIDNWQDIKLGKQGVIVRKGNQSGVFLPQVAKETNWSLEEFLANLCSQKAGLEPDCYKTGECELWVFEVEVF